MRAKWSVVLLVGGLGLSSHGPAGAQAAGSDEYEALVRARWASIEMEQRLRSLSTRMDARHGLELERVRGRLARLSMERASLGAARVHQAALVELRHRLEAATFGAPPARAGRWIVEPEATAPEPWLPQDPADSLYRAAREALNRGDYQQSVDLFGQIRVRYPESGYVGGSYYFEALALQRSGGSERLEAALERLDTVLRDHPDVAVRDEARALRLRIRTELARRGDAESAMEVAQEAEQSCEGEDQEIRAAALSALLQMDAERATPILKEILRDRDRCSADLREQAVFILARKAEPDAETVDLLLDLAYRDPDPDPGVRENAVFWLSHVPGEEALDALASILEAPDADEDIQENALYAVSRHESPRAVEILRSYAERADAPRNLREDAIFRIGQSERFGGGAYLRGLYDRIEDPSLREAVVYGVARGEGEENGRWLLERARDASEDPDVRRQALFWAGQTGVVGPAELRGLYSTFPDTEMKEQVIVVLGREGGTEAVDALMEIAEGEEDPELRQQAVHWLGRTDDPRVADFLLRIIRGGG